MASTKQVSRKESKRSSNITLVEILPGFHIVDLVLQMSTLKERTIIVGDVHIGYEEALNKQGYMVPRFHFQDIISRMNSILETTKPDKIILIGDVKHEFGRISDQEWRETIQFLDLLLENDRKVILIRGNHDTILGPIASKRNLKIVPQYLQSDVLFIHGDTVPDDLPKEAKIIVIGHEHPAVAIRDRVRSEIFKCFLKGSWKRKKLIVLPSFHPLTEGTNILQEKLLSPFLHQDLSDFDVYVVGDITYHFGKLKNLK